MDRSKPYWVRKPGVSKAAIIFVHGILTKPDAAWRSGKTFWPELICSEPELHDVGVYVFVYRNDIFSGNYRISDAVDSLRDYLELDGLSKLSNLLFVCHSMGGIVVRQFLVNQQTELIEKKVKIGLFLIASPSLGAEYANLFTGLAKAIRNEQVEALRFADNNTQLNNLDRDFINLKESGKLFLMGKELVENDFIVLPRIIGSYVVKPFSGAKYFGKSIKIDHSNHFTIAEIADSTALQHRLLVQLAKRLFDIADDPNLPGLPPPEPEAVSEGVPKPPNTKRWKILLGFLVLTAGCSPLIWMIKGRLKKPPISPPLFSQLIPLPVIDTRWLVNAIAAADLDNSGKPALVTINVKPAKDGNPIHDEGSLSVLLGVSESGFQSVTTYKTDEVPYGVKVAHLHDDQIDDVVITNKSDGTMTVFLGNGDGTLRNGGKYVVGGEPTMPAVGDFNNDGVNDIAVGSWTDDTVTVFLGKGNGTFGEPRKFKASIQSACVAVGRFGSDGNLDLAVANNARSEIAILSGAGDGTFLAARYFATMPHPQDKHQGPWWGPYDILVADFNEDGHDDLAVTNFSDHNIGVLLGKGDGTFELPKNFDTDEGPFSLAVGDFNADGKADLVTANNSDTVSVLLGNGDGTFQKKQTYETRGSSTSIVVGDFNGDGKQDLAIASRDRDFIGVLLNSKGVTPTFTRLYVIGASPTQGFPVTIKAVVTSAQGPVAGQVQFRIESEALATQTLKGGEAVFSTSALRKGPHILTAEYQGSDHYSRSSARTSLNVR